MQNNLFNKRSEEIGKYTVNIDKEDLISLYARKWVLKWCRENRPDLFDEGRTFVKGLLNEEKGLTLDEKR